LLDQGSWTGVMKAYVKGNAEVLDIDRALGRVGGDLDFLLELVGIFQAACPALMDNTREAVACGDVDAIERTAHLFKAAADYVSATKSYDAALQLERMAHAGRLQNVQEAFEKLEQELALLSPRLAAFENALWFAES
jgi:HPt (histidine-containing phosphotransfer) domain-containing protein